MANAKFTEDNRLRRASNFYEYEKLPLPEPKIIYFDCYYCNCTLLSNEERNIHILQNHNQAEPLLLLNDKIASSENYVETIDSIKLSHRNPDLNIISINGVKIPVTNIYMDLLNLIDKSRNDFIIQIGNRQLRIFKLEKINLRSYAVDKIIKEWDYQIRNSMALHPSNGFYPCDLNVAELDYLNGIFEYYTACKTLNVTDKLNRYQTSNAILGKFSHLTNRANFIQKIIAFKLNNLQTLKRLTFQAGGKDIFYPILDFYSGKESINYSQEHKDSIFVEDELYCNFETIAAYQRKEITKVEMYLRDWTEERLSLLKDINLKDRIYLLKGRIFDEKYLRNVINPNLLNFKC